MGVTLYDRNIIVYEVISGHLTVLFMWIYNRFQKPIGSFTRLENVQRHVLNLSVVCSYRVHMCVLAGYGIWIGWFGSKEQTLNILI